MRCFMTIAVGLFMLVAVAKADEEKVLLDKVPKAVLEAVKAKFPDAKVVSAEKEADDGKIVYEVAITNKDQKIEVTLTTDGKIVEIEKQIAAKDMPKAVTEILEAKYPKATYTIIEEIIKVKDGKAQPQYYEVLLVTAEKKKLEVSVASDGKITNEEDKSKEKDDGDNNNKNDGQKNQKDDGRRKDDGQKPKQRREKDGQGPRLFPPGIEKLDLTGEQKEKLTKLQGEFQEKLESAKKKLTEAMEQAKNAQDRQKAQEAEQTFRKDVAKLQEEVQGQLKQVLTEEQKNKLAAAGEGQRREGGKPGFDLLRILGQLDLSAEQKQKVEATMKDFGEKQEAAQAKFKENVEQAKQDQDREKAQELFKAHQQNMGKLHEELHKNLLTLLNDEQRKKFAEQSQRRGEGGFPGPGFVAQVLPPPLQERLGLTPEQREKVAQLQRDTESKLRDILNEEQNKKLEELKKGGPAGRPKPKE